MNYNWSWSVFLDMSPDGVHTFLETLLIGVGGRWRCPDRLGLLCCWAPAWA